MHPSTIFNWSILILALLLDQSIAVTKCAVCTKCEEGLATKSTHLGRTEACKFEYICLSNHRHYCSKIVQSYEHEGTCGHTWTGPGSCQVLHKQPGFPVPCPNPSPTTTRPARAA
ncbi:hypothetical protein PGTUg99_002037 [Puccinia graminis f. sp. tritici]|uniref:Secreted protein n=1 Tax=Puccinia graminis f. sp. tritici TaxID=56615 RepID=A0A5B0SII1_PUCGR|nr:hypothetical protein PGTUg99_002037 [Puccinia graminis f. sp. tritici]